MIRKKEMIMSHGKNVGLGAALLRFSKALEDYARATRDIAVSNERMARGALDVARISHDIERRASSVA